MVKVEEIQEINELLKDRPELKGGQLYTRNVEFIRTVLNMSEWNDPKFKGLLTANIWRTNIENIRKILSMPEWNDPRFQGLLTPNIWNSRPKTIEIILVMREWDDPKFQGLLTSNIWRANVENIKEILSMREWDNPKFQGLLTPNIWHSSANDIKMLFGMKKIQQDEYIHLLCPSIFNVSFQNIVPSIELFEEYGIGKYITNRCLRRNVDLQRKLLEYLISNNMDLIVRKKGGSLGLNPVLNVSNSDLKKKYDIDIKKLNFSEVKK